MPTRAIGERNTGRYLTANRAEYAYTDDLARPSRRRRAVTRKGDPLPPPGAERRGSILYVRPLPFIRSNISFRESPSQCPLSNKEQIISLLFARYRALALPRFPAPASFECSSLSRFSRHESTNLPFFSFFSFLSFFLSLLPFLFLPFFISFSLALSLYRPRSGLAIFFGGRPKSIHRVFHVRFRARGTKLVVLFVFHFLLFFHLVRGIFTRQFFVSNNFRR